MKSILISDGQGLNFLGIVMGIDWHCDACGIELPKSVLQKNQYNYWSEFLDWCPSCGAISTHSKFFSRIEKIHKDLKEILEEIKKVKENAKCEVDMTSKKPFKITFDV